MNTLFKRFFPEFVDRPNYEEGLQNALKCIDIKLKNIIIIGGGYGVIAVKCANILEIDGGISVYEASKIQVEIIKKTLRLNRVNKVKLINQPVGEVISVYNQETPSNILDPVELPCCDLLLMDCEGAEKFIIQKIKNMPEKIIVETHGFLGSSTSEIETYLKSIDYKVIDLGWAEPSDVTFCSNNDIKILYASKT